MSELRADTITASDGASPVTLTKQSAAKAWIDLRQPHLLQTMVHLTSLVCQTLEQDMEPSASSLLWLMQITHSPL